MTKPTFVYSEEKDILSLFTPFAYLQFGPSPEDAVILYFISSNYINGNEILEIYNPHTRISNFTSMQILYPTDNLQPSFDSFFLFNRMNDQIIPLMSNFTVELAPISNPEQVRNHYTQIKTGDPISLSPNNKSNSTKLFSIPSDINSGSYLAILTAYLPDYNVKLKFSNIVYIDKDLTSSLPPESNTSLSFNPNQSLESNSSYLQNNLFE